MEYKGYVVAAVLALLWAVESVFPHFEHFVQNRRGRLVHGARNLSVGLINGLVVGIVLAMMTKWGTDWAASVEFGLLHAANLPVWANAIAAILIIDLWMYWWHRFNHQIPFFWRFHRMHHSDLALDATSALRFHPGEVLLGGTLRVFVIVLLGLTLWHVVLYELILLPVILIHHSNFNIPRRLDAALRWLFVTPWVHWVHHSHLPTETNSNYGSVFTFWDRLFRSFRLRQQPREIVYGLDGWEDNTRQSLVGMLKTPLLGKFADTQTFGRREKNVFVPDSEKEVL